MYCLPKWYINCIIQSNKRRRKVKDSNQNIAKAVLKIRQDNKLSQEQFAEMVGVTRQAVSRWEMGVSVPNINTRVLIFGTETPISHLDTACLVTPTISANCSWESLLSCLILRTAFAMFWLLSFTFLLLLFDCIIQLIYHLGKQYNFTFSQLTIAFCFSFI